MPQDHEETTGISAEEAGNAFSKLLDPQAGDTDEDEALEAAADHDDEEDEESAASEDEDDDGDADDDEEADEGSKPAPKLHRVKVDGQELEVTEEDLVKSYQIEAAAKQRLTKAAEAEKKANAELGALQAFKQRADTVLAAVEAQIQADPRYNDAEMARLRDEDPGEWSARRDELKDREDKLAELRGKAEAAAKAAEAKANEQAEARIDKEVELLKSAVPEWKDAKTFTKEYDALGAFAAETYGVKPEEFATISDHRVLLALRDAQQFRSAKAKAAGAVNMAKAKASDSPTLQPGSGAGPKGQGASELSRAAKRLKQTGRVKDAARAFSALI